MTSGGTETAAARRRARPPIWLLVCTGALAITILVLAVAETNLTAHYLIDQGESLSVAGLAFIMIAGVYLFTQQRLYVSLPLVFPWLLYPIITQGDQIIDNLSINSMRAICDVLLAAIFATPVAVVVLAVRGFGARSDRSLDRRRASQLAATLMAPEIWLAYLYLGELMIVTLVVMIVGTLLYGMVPSRLERDAAQSRTRTERFALAVLVGGCTISLGAYYAYKNAPGAYQGSPSFLMDPTQKDAIYHLDTVPLPLNTPTSPAAAVAAGEALTAYARMFDTLLAGYHILDRNYTYDFHNALFLRHWPLLPRYREAGLRLVDDARRLRVDADQRARIVRSTLRADDPLAALLDDLRGFAAFDFNRAPLLEQLSAGFARTPAGLQHAAHLYEGESKYVAAGVWAIAKKHHAILEAAVLRPVTSEFAATAQSIDTAYAHHVVGF
jgi:hypothetical protein